MKQLFYIFSLMVIIGSFTSCSNDDDNIWKYGEKQVLANSEWVFTALICGGPLPERSFNFNTNDDFTFSEKKTLYNEELQESESSVIVTRGKYQYKHPQLKLMFEDGLEIDAWISARNTICFNEDNMVSEFVRQ